MRRARRDGISRVLARAHERACETGRSGRQGGAGVVRWRVWVASVQRVAGLHNGYTAQIMDGKLLSEARRDVD